MSKRKPRKRTRQPSPTPPRAVKAWAGMIGVGKRLRIERKGESIAFGQEGGYEKEQRWAMAIYATRAEAKRAYACVQRVEIRLLGLGDAP